MTKAFSPALRIATPLAAAIALAACEVRDNVASEPTPDPQAEFWTALSSHCGKAYAGELVSEDAADADFVGKAMVMHVRECSEDRIAVPFHVETSAGEWDRSRTWLITKTGAGLRLKHDHRHEDGEPDAVTMYGGDTADQGSAAGASRAQDFPVDAESIALFEREGLTASVTNVWTVEVDPAGTENGVFAYQLKRTRQGGAPEDRFFRVEFDLTQEVEAPPAAWGWE
ncbi:MAG: hypothetical protein AAGL68_08545 [Pseudomonadota bacterium]